MSKNYNGHDSYNAWNVALWIANDEGLYRFAREIIRKTSNRMEAAQVFVEAMQSAADGVAQTPDGVPWTVSNVRKAMVGL